MPFHTPHIASLELAPHHPSLQMLSTAPLAPCSVRDVFLSFPAWNGPGCYQDVEALRKTEEVISRLKPGDPLRICKTRNKTDRNPWHVHAPYENGWHHIGKMQRAFEPGLPGEELYSEVFALVAWRKADSSVHHHDRIHLDHWFTVIPEWGPVKG